MRQTDFTNDEAVGFLADRLKLGVEERAVQAGRRAGRRVVIGTRTTASSSTASPDRRRRRGSRPPRRGPRLDDSPRRTNVAAARGAGCQARVRGRAHARPVRADGARGRRRMTGRARGRPRESGSSSRSARRRSRRRGRHRRRTIDALVEPSPPPTAAATRSCWSPRARSRPGSRRWADAPPARPARPSRLPPASARAC